jgi:hypothetical protein
MANVGDHWPCRFCGLKNKHMSARRIHEHTCPQRPEVKASQEYIRTHPKSSKEIKR